MNLDIFILISNIIFLIVEIIDFVDDYKKGDITRSSIDAFFIGSFLVLVLVYIKILIK